MQLIHQRFELSKSNPTDVITFSDSKSAIEALQNPIYQDQITLEIAFGISNLIAAHAVHFTLQWISGHCKNIHALTQPISNNLTKIQNEVCFGFVWNTTSVWSCMDVFNVFFIHASCYVGLILFSRTGNQGGRPLEIRMPTRTSWMWRKCCWGEYQLTYV